MPVISATQEQESGGSWFEASLGKKLVIPPSQSAVLGMTCIVIPVMRKA
jgi:hypothetical protein